MKKERRPDSFLPKPVYPGGMKALSKFIGENLKYPEEALKNKIEGVVRIKLRINYKGNVQSSQVMSGIGYGCDQEAKRLVKLLKFKASSKMRKGKVTFGKLLNIRFRLPNESTQNGGRSTGLKYTIVKKKGEDDDGRSSGKNSYHYTINV